MARWIDATARDFDDVFQAFLKEPRGAVENVAETVREVIRDVRENGGEAVAR